VNENTVGLIAVVAFVLSALSFIGAQLAARKSTKLTAEEKCRDELERANLKIERLTTQVQVLQDENFSLMRKLMGKDYM